jgi:hypothetical protein
VDNWKHIFLWKDKWLIEEPLNMSFNRLIGLSVTKNISEVDMYRRGWRVGGETWSWR